MSRRSAARHSSPQRAPRRAVLGDRRWGGAGSDDDTTAPRQQPTHADEAYGPMTNPLASDLDTESRVFSEANHIYFFAGVSKDSIYQLKAELLVQNRSFEDLQRTNPAIKMTPEPIFLHIDSFGGSVFAAFAGIDFITQSAIPVHTIVEGATASAGTLLSIAGVKRYMSPNASMLIHQLSAWFGGKMTEIDDEFQNLTQMMDSIRGLYKQYTRLGDEELKVLLSRDVWWKVDVCLEKGLVDEVWNGKDGGTATAKL